MQTLLLYTSIGNTMTEHYEICKALAKALFAAKRNNTTAHWFVFELSYANYEASCNQHNIKTISKDDFLAIQTSKEVVFLPFV